MSAYAKIAARLHWEEFVWARFRWETAGLCLDRQISYAARRAELFQMTRYLIASDRAERAQ